MFLCMYISVIHLSIPLILGLLMGKVRFRCRNMVKIIFWIKMLFQGQQICRQYQDVREGVPSVVRVGVSATGSSLICGRSLAGSFPVSRVNLRCMVRSLRSWILM